MTLIGLETTTDGEQIVGIAESMESILHPTDIRKNRKFDHKQKLFLFGNHVMLTSGDTRAAQEIVNEISQHNFQLVAELAHHANNFAHGELYDDASIGLLFAGKSEDGVEAFQVSMNYPDLKDDFGQVKNYWLGSGRDHVDAYKRVARKHDFYREPLNIYEGLMLIHTLGKEGTENGFVNDKFQYVTVTPEGISLLTPPHLQFFTPEMKLQYLSHMTGRLTEDPERQSHEDFGRIQENNQEIEKRLIELYQNLFHHLEEYSERDAQLDNAYLRWKLFDGSVRRMEHNRDRCYQIEERVLDGIDAMLSRNLGNIVAYNRSIAKASRAEEDFALTLPQIE